MENDPMLTLYLRREPTTDPATLESYGQAGLPVPASHRDAVAYRDPQATDRAARWPWHYSNRPDRRFRRVMFNCYRWNVVWLPDLEAAS